MNSNLQLLKTRFYRSTLQRVAQMKSNEIREIPTHIKASLTYAQIPPFLYTTTPLYQKPTHFLT